MSDPEEEIISRLRRTYEAFSRADFDTAMELAHPDIEFIPPGGQSPMRGAAALRAWMEPDAIAEQRIEPREFRVNGNNVLVHHHAWARGAGSGIELEVDAWVIWTFDDRGLVTRVEAFLDHQESQALEAAGLSEQAMSQENVSVAEAAVQFWNQGDREGFLGVFHPEARWSSAIKRQVEGGEGLYSGREEIGRFWGEWHAVWDELKISVSEIRSPRDGLVCAFGALHGTGIGSGVGLERPFGWVFHIEGGLIHEVRAYLSRDEALEAAGLSE